MICHSDYQLKIFSFWCSQLFAAPSIQNLICLLHNCILDLKIHGFVSDALVHQVALCVPRYKKTRRSLYFVTPFSPCIKLSSMCFV